MLLKMDCMQENWVNFWASAFARAVQSVICNPLIVIKTRLEVLGFKEYNGITDAVTKIYRNEGMIGFFTGLKISLIRDVPFSGIFYPIYEISKHFYMLLLRFDPDEHNVNRRVIIHTILTSLSAITANLLSCIVTHPIDTIRTRVFF
jgi:hypothetical protein